MKIDFDQLTDSEKASIYSAFSNLATFAFDNHYDLNDDDDLKDAMIDLNVCMNGSNISDEELEELVSEMRQVQEYARAAKR